MGKCNQKIIVRTFVLLCLVILLGPVHVFAQDSGAGSSLQILLQRAGQLGKTPDQLSAQDINVIVGTIYQDLIRGEVDPEIIQISRIICDSLNYVMQRYVGQLSRINTDPAFQAYVQNELTVYFQQRLLAFANQRGQ